MIAHLTFYLDIPEIGYLDFHSKMPGLHQVTDICVEFIHIEEGFFGVGSLVVLEDIRDIHAFVDLE